jgi:hypothetical protein
MLVDLRPDGTMARYKYIDTNPKLVPVDLARPLLPGTFEHAPNYLLDGPIDLSSFDARFQNDETGAPAYPPASCNRRQADSGSENPKAISRNDERPAASIARSLAVSVFRECHVPPNWPRSMSTTPRACSQVRIARLLCMTEPHAQASAL